MLRRFISSNLFVIIIAVSAGLAGWFIFGTILQESAPFSYCCDFYENRQLLFTTYGPVFTIMTALSATLVILSINNAGQHTTRFSGLAILFGSLAYIGGVVTAPFFIACLTPLPLVGCSVGIAQVMNNRKYWGNLFVVAMLIAWLIVSLIFADKVWAIYGD